VVQTAQNALNNSKAEVDVSQGYKMYFKWNFCSKIILICLISDI
jgi:hypothetical protein